MGDGFAMNNAGNRERDLAWRVLIREAGDDRSPETLARVTQRCFDRLFGRLAELVGPAGFDALAKRALHLAGLEYPYLKSVVAEVLPNGYLLQGLQASVEGRDKDEARGGLVALLGSFFWLLDTFIGDRLYRRLLQGVWPDLPMETTGLDSEERDA